MILEIDVGNTRIKWRTLQNGSTCDRGALPKEELEKWLRVMGQQKVPDKVRLCCVANRDIVKKVAEQVSRWGCLLQEAKTSHDAAGVCCGYGDPGALGVDRWLAVVAAFNEFGRPCVVVDAGSAVTVDLVDGDGQHLGGYIVPGLGMMRQSLFEGTSQVKVTDFAAVSVEPGCSTKQAVTNGSLLMIKAMVESAAELLKSKIGSAHIVITGGDGDCLMKVLGDQACYLPELVMDGLALIVPEE
jgi:type III pantothenate kinase